MVEVQGRELIARVLDSEWDMFRRVRSAHPAGCRQSPQTFRRVRASIFELWTEDMLASYLTDLQEAGESGRNLFTEKYARMDNLIPRTNFNPLIEKIVTIETFWQIKTSLIYPHLFRAVCRGSGPADDGSNFSVYLRSELETYGARTIELYYEQVEQAVSKGRNLTLEMLQRLVLKGGFRDLDQAERCLTSQSGNAP